MDDIIDINTMFGPLPVAASDLSVEELAAMMHKHGVRACFTLSTLGLLLDHNAGNGATRAACAENRSLLPVATVNPQTCFGGEGPIARLAPEGFKMARFFPSWQGWEVDYAPFLAVAKVLDAERLPIMVNIEQPGTATRLIRAIGGHPSPVILAGVDERTLSEAVALMRASPRVYMETSSLMAAGALKQVVEAVGAERVLYGSGAPSRPMASGLGVLRYAGLTDAQRARVLAVNARELFGM
jgi:predicted TIM-barrel fold metal-dependent hydrolase